MSTLNCSAAGGGMSMQMANKELNHTKNYKIGNLAADMGRQTLESDLMIFTR
jgi:hypothetical protein